MAKCTECGVEIEPQDKYLAGVGFVDFDLKKGKEVGFYEFWWACQHQPAEEAPIRLVSKECVEKFCEKHPECVDAVIEKMTEYRKECQHQVN